MKILIMYQDIEGGTKNATEAIINRLQKTHLQNKYIIYKQRDLSGTAYLSYTRHLVWSIYDFRNLLNKTDDIDCIYFTIFSAAIAKLLSKHRNTPGLFHFHGNQEFASGLTSEQNRFFISKWYSGLLGSVVNKLQKFALYHANKICFVSAFAKQQFLKQHGLSLLDNKTFVLPNGVDAHVFRPASSAQRHRFRTALGYKGIADWVVLYVGRIDEKKGISQLIFSLTLLPPNIKLLIAHPKVREKQSRLHLSVIQSIIETHSLSRRIKLIEDPRNITRLYRVADCTVLPSDREYFSLVLLESFACGVPFIGTRSGFIPEFLSHINTKLILPSALPHTIASTIIWLHRLSSSEQDRLIRRGIQEARKYTWEKVASTLVEEFARLCATQSR